MVNDIDVLIAYDVRAIAGGSRIDYQNSAYGEGFSIAGAASC
jgi:hypothetical protein